MQKKRRQFLGKSAFAVSATFFLACASAVFSAEENVAENPVVSAENSVVSDENSVPADVVNAENSVVPAERPTETADVSTDAAEKPAETASSAGTVLPPVEAGSVRIEADSMRFSAETGEQQLHGNVTVTAGALQLRTQELVYNSSTDEISTQTRAELDYEDARLVVEKANFDGAEQKLVAENVRGGKGIGFFEGDTLLISRKRVEIGNASFYVGEPHWSSLSFTTENLAYDADEDYFYLEPSQVRVAGAPIIPLPALSVMRFDRPPVRVWLDLGESGTPGVYYRSEVYLTLWDFEPGVVLDFYERSGVLAGPAAAYDTRDSNSFLKMKGTLRTGYINDTAHRGHDIYDNSITGNRGFIDWFHKQDVGDVEVSASIHRWSDSMVERNFRPDIYDENQNPDNYVEVVYPQRQYYLSAFTRLQPNDYQNVQQRLPEIRFDLQPTELGRTGIYQHLNASYALLRERSSDQFDFDDNYVSTNHDDMIESSRANVYVGWTMPFKFGDFASFTPVAGIMTTHYGETIDDADESYTRTLGQVGFDLDFIFTRTWDYRNELWEIDGLRHVFRPVIQYRYIPNPTDGDDYIPAIDREIYLSRPTIIDLSDSRAIDQLYDEHVFRIGFENLFQTRASDYGSRDLFEFNIYQDFRKTYRPDDDRTLSDNFIDLRFTPAYWVSFSLEHRFDVYDCHTNSLSTSLTFTDGDVWKIRISTDHLYENPYPSEYGTDRSREVDLAVEIRLNSVWTAFFEWEYDDRKNLMTDQIYGVRQRLGNSWLIEYSVRYKQDAGDDDDFSFDVGATMLLF